MPIAFKKPTGAPAESNRGENEGRNKAPENPIGPKSLTQRGPRAGMFSARE